MKPDWFEHILIKSLTVKKKKAINQKILSSLKKEHFVSDVYKETFNRLYSYYSKKNVILTWKELIADSTLNESTVRKLRAREVKRKKTVKKDDGLRLPLDLQEYTTIVEKVLVNSKFSHLVKLQNSLTEHLNNSEVSISKVNKILNTSKEAIENITQLDNSEQSRIINLNKKSVKSIFNDFKNKLDSGYFIPTGFTDFDRRNVGLALDSYILIAAKTGCGKSTFGLQLAMNIKKNGYRVAYLPLEMSEAQMLLRMGSNLLDVELLDIVKNFGSYQKKLEKKLGKFLKKDKDTLACFDFYIPEIGQNLENVLNVLKPGDYDIIIVDYIKLLGSMHKDEWKSLDLAGAYSKIWATKNQTIIALLAQLDKKEEDIRYAKALEEHATNSFVWTEAKDKILEQGFITVKDTKGRNQDPKPFKLNCCFPKFRLSDYIYVEDDDNDDNDDYNPKSFKRRKTKKIKKGFDNV